MLLNKITLKKTYNAAEIKTISNSIKTSVMNFGYKTSLYKSKLSALTFENYLFEQRKFYLDIFISQHKTLSKLLEETLISQMITNKTDTYNQIFLISPIQSQSVFNLLMPNMQALRVESDMSTYLYQRVTLDKLNQYINYDYSANKNPLRNMQQ